MNPNIVRRPEQIKLIMVCHMLGNISVASNIYIITGYTDMRKSVDGLCAIVMGNEHSIYFSVAGVVTASRSFYAIRIGMYFYIKDLMWYREDTAGQGAVQR